MHDIARIRADPAAFDHDLARRGLPPLAAPLLSIADCCRSHQTFIDSLRQRRNQLAKHNSPASHDEARQLRSQITTMEAQLTELQAGLMRNLSRIPNRLDPDVP